MTSPGRVGPLVVVIALITFMGVAADGADTLIATPGLLKSSEGRPLGNNFGHVAEVVVGDRDVVIGKVGFLGRVEEDARVSWVIFEDEQNSLPVFRTEVSNLRADGERRWIDSGEFPERFVLRAGARYWIGFIVDGPPGAVTFFYNDTFPPPGVGQTLTLNGLTLPLEHAANPRGRNADTARIAIGSSTAQLGVRIFPYHGDLVLKPITSITVTPDGIRLTIPLVPLRNIGVAYSADLSPGSWIELGNFFARDGHGEFVDPDLTRQSRPRGYYRAILRPKSP